MWRKSWQRWRTATRSAASPHLRLVQFAELFGGFCKVGGLHRGRPCDQSLNICGQYEGPLKIIQMRIRRAIKTLVPLAMMIEDPPPQHVVACPDAAGLMGCGVDLTALRSGSTSLLLT